MEADSSSLDHGTDTNEGKFVQFRETGKSCAGNTILGHSGLFQAGTVTEECVRQQANVSQRHVTVVDTPGWEGGVMGTTPERVKREIVTSVGLCPPGPHAFLLALRIDTAVRESHICNHLELLGEDTWRYTILLFTHCDQLREGVSIEKHIQKGGKELQMLLKKCKGRYHAISYANGLQKATQVTEFKSKSLASLFPDKMIVFVDRCRLVGLTRSIQLIRVC
uniref:AIG1-type G domain-containing protein n=1 Tax=Periophthalmus magnuspinnatus TaxID=409849 RepID=A0A3B4AYN3_9GOBI